MMKRIGVVSGLLLTVLLAVPAAAQQASAGSASGSEPGRVEGRSPDGFRVVERSGAIRVDGRLAETAWDDARAITDFVQGVPVEGAEAEQRTVVRVVFDDQAIYVGARLTETATGIARQLVRRDETGQADYFEVSFDPNLDRRTGYQFRVTAAGVQSDAYLYEDNREDESWDAVWESDVVVEDGSWTVEMRIPWSQIRYEPSTGPQTWGVNFVRWRVGAGERTYYALEPRNRHGKVSFFKPMSGVRVPASMQRIELRPYVLARGQTGPVQAGDPFFDGTAANAQAGFDLRYGLGSAFTLDATVNPDFGQVELDPAVINLSAFETFFPEKRPFFVEDARILDFDLSGRRNSLFYSRRIGREPRGRRPAGAAYTDVPDQSTILGAAKLTGRTSSGLSLGVLTAVTDAEQGRAFFPGNGVTADSMGTYLAQPRNFHSVARVQQDLRDGATTIGGIITGIWRDLPADGSFDFLPTDAYSLGLDFEHMWGDREWALQGFVAGSLVRGDTAAMIRIQESSNHYFQRPDSEFRVDSTARSMVGADWRLEFERRSGDPWTGSVWLGQVTPGFEVNDLGYSRSNERLDGGARVTYREIQPGPVFRDYSFTAFTFHNWRHEALDDPWSYGSWGRAHKAGVLMLNGRGTLNNFWGGSIRVGYSPETLDDGATRGGPLMVDPAGVSGQVEVNTDRRKPVSLRASVSYDRGEGGRRLEGGLGVTLRPGTSWELQLQPSYSDRSDAAQYVTAVADPSFAPTYGARYIFGELDRRSFSLETRLNVTFTPALTLQLFLQPLLEAGRYDAYKQLAAAETFEFDRFAAGSAVDADGDGAADACTGGSICSLDGTRFLDFDGDGSTDAAFRDRDFNVVSLRGNAVLRWEYRPGSTLFLVWQQRRYDRRPFGDFDFERDRGDMLGLHPENVFIIKLNYWLGL
ncbi:MAG: DUF5916 domain-containing protein [Longimicrobiales bacterium]|nr:DUF5916 domain-containing protein [Longimicrobiales bacterium]